MRKFYLYHWVSIDSLHPEKPWVAYQEQVKLVNQEFGTTINYGFETDRGRVYLQYGAPNQLQDYPREPGAYPYQIWEYYKLERQGPAKFVFYNRDLVTNEYELIHSNALNESQNNQWQKLVYGGNRTVSPTDIGTDLQDHYGRDASDNYRNP
jgi:GWxTD domain-containing protein